MCENVAPPCFYGNPKSTGFKDNFSYFNSLAIISLVALVTCGAISSKATTKAVQIKVAPRTSWLSCCCHRRLCHWCSHRQVPNSTSYRTGAQKDVVKTGIQAGAGRPFQKGVSVRPCCFVCFAQAADRCPQSQSFRKTDVQRHRRPLQMWDHPV